MYTRALFTPVQLAGYRPSAGQATIENWVGENGTWRLRETIPGRAPGSIDLIVGGDGRLPPQANATGAVNGAPINDDNPGDGLFTTRQLNQLPANTVALKARLEQAVTSQELRNLQAYVRPGPYRAAELARLRPMFLASHTADMLTAISALDLTPLPPTLPAALYRVAHELPGVRTTLTRDRLGRPGIQIAGQRLALTFDPHTGGLRASTTGPYFNQGTAGTIIAQGRVTNVYTIPRGLSPIRGMVARPPVIALTPRAGTPTTTFRLQVFLPKAQRASTNAPRLIAQMFGPTGPDCTHWRSRPSAVQMPAGIISHNHRGPVATYRFGPATVGHDSWCAGRYQLLLMIPPASSPTGVPRSFASAYFTAH